MGSSIVSRMRTLSVILCLVSSVTLAPQWANNLKSLVGELSGDEEAGEVNGDYEQVPYEVIQKFEGYEERRYPSVNFACTELEYTPDLESSSSWSLEKVLRYIAGVNKQQQEVEMTVPVISKMQPLEDGQMYKEMCFYITKEFQENPPEPADEEVKIKKSNERIVFVKQFGGYAMKDDVWLEAAEKFRKEMADREAELMMDHFYTAGYDSPMKFWNRRNEVMFEKKNNEVDIV